MSGTRRRIIVDDADASITYSSSQWESHSQSDLAATGYRAYRGSGHSSTQNGAMLSFAFTGTSIDVYGPLPTTTLENGVGAATYECRVDAALITSASATSDVGFICGAESLSADAHTLTLTVHTAAESESLYIDSIAYTPVQDALTVDGAVVEYRNSDPSVSFGSGWTLSQGQNLTQATSAEVALNFHGTEVTLVGTIPESFPRSAATAHWKLDAGVSGSSDFQIAPDAGALPAVILTLTGLPRAAHNLVIAYNGDTSHAPLTVGTFYVVNAADTPAPAKKPAPVGAIAGGAVGGAVLLLAVLLLVLFYRRRRRRKPQTDSSKPSEMVMHPYVEGQPLAPLPGPSPASDTTGSYLSSGRHHTFSPFTTHISGASATGKISPALSPGSSSPSTPTVAASSSEGSSGKSGYSAQRTGVRERPVMVQQHSDSGLRLPRRIPEVEQGPLVVELLPPPPGYSP